MAHTLSPCLTLVATNELTSIPYYEPKSLLYSHVLSFTQWLFLFSDPTLHLSHHVSGGSFRVTVSQTSLVFGGLDSFEESWSGVP